MVDMRTEEWFLDATIPGSVNIPYTEVAMRMDEPHWSIVRQKVAQHLGNHERGGLFTFSQSQSR
ncbi:MAG: hypothetical protein AAF236_11740 [Verrucomicrobiota bacterium]